MHLTQSDPEMLKIKGWAQTGKKKLKKQGLKCWYPAGNAWLQYNHKETLNSNRERFFLWNNCSLFFKLFKKRQGNEKCRQTGIVQIKVDCGLPGGISGGGPTCNAGDLGWEDSLEKEMATHSSILPWEIPWEGELTGLQSMKSQRVGNNGVTKPPQGDLITKWNVWSWIELCCLSPPAPRIYIYTHTHTHIYIAI